MGHDTGAGSRTVGLQEAGQEAQASKYTAKMT